MSDFQPGEIVDITIKGARVERVTKEGFDSDAVDVAQFVAHDSAGRPYYVTLPLEWDTITVERRAPAEWPPKPGDLWRDSRGVLWFHQSYYVSAGDMGGYSEDRMVRASGSESFDHLPEFIQARGPLTLVHREGEQDGGRP